MNLDNKPEYLYRGIVISYAKFKELVLSGVDLTPIYAPVLDEHGRKVDSYDNEYGLYMTESERMAQDVYGTVRAGGTSIQNKVDFSLRFGSVQNIKIPDVAMIYKIKTDGLSIKQPEMRGADKDHPNNDYDGNIWITDRIPFDNYQVVKIRIGKDFLHSAEDMEIKDGDINKAKAEADKNLEMRKYRLDSLGNEMSKMSETQRKNISETKMEVLRDIFGPNGVRYTNINSMDTSSNKGKLQYLLASFYNNSPGIIDYKTLEYIETVKQKITKSNDSENVESLNQIISGDLKLNEDRKQSFINEKTTKGLPIDTSAFVNTATVINAVVNKLTTITKQGISKQINKTQFLNQQQANQYPPNDLRQEGEKLNLTEAQVLEEERRKRRENFSAYIDPKMQAEILNSLFNDSAQPESFVEDVDQIENGRVR